jgi:hypothetical protein
MNSQDAVGLQAELRGSEDLGPFAHLLLRPSSQGLNILIKKKRSLSLYIERK